MKLIFLRKEILDNTLILSEKKISPVLMRNGKIWLRVIKRTLSRTRRICEDLKRGLVRSGWRRKSFWRGVKCPGEIFKWEHFPRDGYFIEKSSLDKSAPAGSWLNLGFDGINNVYDSDSNRRMSIPFFRQISYSSCFSQHSYSELDAHQKGVQQSDRVKCMQRNLVRISSKGVV